VDISVVDEIDQIRYLASRVTSLPALPLLATRLMEAVDDPDTSASDLAILISSDPALATRLLKLANSAFYGFARRIGTVNLAVVVLGFETVRDLSLSVIISDCFIQGSNNVALDMEEFWKHSISVAIASRMIYKMSGASHPGEAFIAGLVHDLGKLFLSRYYPEDYIRVLNKTDHQGYNLIDAEKEVFLVSHPVAGAWLLDEWNMPAWMVESTRNHHAPVADSEHKKLVLSVHFANHLATIMNIEDKSADLNFDSNPEFEKLLKLRKDDQGAIDFPFYLEAIKQELNRSEGFIGTIRKPY